MIQANELKIGNLVYYNGNLQEIGSVTEIKKNLITGDECVVLDYRSDILHQTQYLQPIPITEEWLLKCGFDKRESSVCDAFYIGINPITKDWLFDIVWLKNMMDYSYEDFAFYRNGHHKIHSVHQLQNLYFALTGEELEINN
jgi:hypothetical protein